MATKRKTPPRGPHGRFVSTKRHHAKKRTYRRNPESRAKRSRAAKLGWRRREHEHRSHHTHHRSHHAKRRTYRRNPSGGAIARVLKSALLPSAVFPIGALANDLVHGFIPMPATMKTGIWPGVTKLGTGIALGIAGAMFLPRETARMFIAGTVGGAIYDTARTHLQTAFPTLSLSGYGDYPSITYETGGAPSSVTGPGNNAALGRYVDRETPARTGGSVGRYVTNYG